MPSTSSPTRTRRSRRTLVGKVRNNIIGPAGVTGSGSTVGFPIRVQNEGRVPVTMAITDNTINESVGFTGINVITTTAGTGATNVTITGNSVNNIDSGHGVLVQQIDHTTAGLNAGTVCAAIYGRTVLASNRDPVITGIVLDFDDYAF